MINFARSVVTKPAAHKARRGVVRFAGTKKYETVPETPLVVRPPVVRVHPQPIVISIHIEDVRVAVQVVIVRGAIRVSTP